MKYREILKYIRLLAGSQGFYRSILRRIETMPKGNLKLFKKMLEAKKFSNIFDMCEYFEGLQLQ